MGNQLDIGQNQQNPTILTKEDIEMLKVNTESDEDEICSWHRQFIKMSPDGYMNFDTFNNFYSCCNPGLTTTAIAKLVFQHLDRRKMNSLNFYEFFIFNSVYRKSNARDRAKLVFELCDLDKNGAISVKELTKLLEALYSLNKSTIDTNLLKKKAIEIIDRIDINQDRKLQKSEFVYSMLFDPEIAELISFDFGFDVPQ